jgi:hypothetical protein
LNFLSLCALGDILQLFAVFMIGLVTNEEGILDEQFMVNGEPVVEPKEGRAYDAKVNSGHRGFVEDDRIGGRDPVKHSGPTKYTLSRLIMTTGRVGS